MLLDPMTHADFVHLRLHTAYSLSEGAIQVKALAPLCVRAQMPAVAITDTGNLFGALELSELVAAAGVQPIIGCVLGVRETRPDDVPDVSRLDEPARLVLLVQNEQGYQNLLQLSSRAFLETDSGDTPHVTFDLLEKYSDGLIVLTGGAGGPVGRLLADGQNDAARNLLKQLIGIYPGRLYVELQRHGIPIEEQTEAGFLDLAYELDLPLVATNDVLFEHEGFYDAQDALICIADGTYVAQQDRRRSTREHRFKSAKEMRVLFADLPEAVDNTHNRIEAVQKAPLFRDHGA